MVYLFILVWYVGRGNTIPQALQSNYWRRLLEVTYAVLSPVLTLAYAVFTGDYGLAGAWCWIKALDENCNTTISGLMSQLFEGYVFFISDGIMIRIILMVAVATVYCRLSQTLQESRMLLKNFKMLFVMVFFFVYIVIQVFAFGNRMITAKIATHQYFAIWFIIAITYPASLLLFPLAFVFNLRTL